MTETVQESQPRICAACGGTTRCELQFHGSRRWMRVIHEDRTGCDRWVHEGCVERIQEEEVRWSGTLLPAQCPCGGGQIAAGVEVSPTTPAIETSSFSTDFAAASSSSSDGEDAAVQHWDESESDGEDEGEDEDEGHDRSDNAVDENSPGWEPPTGRDDDASDHESDGDG
ncbi:MAG TPA: hypothetical protein VLK34_02665 [Nocardioidaceae bacterium]|nr:hypothetical protein [Nocardioidaceae bacterium]